MIASTPKTLNGGSQSIYLRFTMVFLFILIAFLALLGSSYISLDTAYRIDTLSLNNVGLLIAPPAGVLLASIGLFYLGTRSDRRISSSGAAQHEKVSDTTTPSTMIIPADVEAYLSSLLEASSDTGTLVFVRSQDRTVLGVFLSREEYELLSAAAALARNPDRLASLLRPSGKKLVTFEEAFHVRDK